MSCERRLLVIDLDTAAPVRERVGSTAWFVLEAVAARSPAHLAVIEIACSSRALADAVGLSKDTVARVLQLLAAAGIVERVDHRDARSGRFASTTYVVDLAAAGITVTAVSDTTVTATGSTASSPVEPDLSGDQLSLLT